jgi:hypothetical protein
MGYRFARQGNVTISQVGDSTNVVDAVDVFTYLDK